MSATHLRPRPPHVLSIAPRAFAAAFVAAIAWSAVFSTDSLAAIVYFPVSSGGSISQPGTGQQPVLVAFGSINLGTGTFTVGSTFGGGNAPSFGVGLNPPEAPSAQQFFTQSNNSIAWLVPAGTVSLLTAGGTVGAGTYSGQDPFFGADWRAGVAPGYAGLQMTSGSDTYYGWASISYTVGSPDQVTVNAFAFENQPNTPITVAAVPEPTTTLAVGFCTVGLAAIMLRRRTNQNS
ncbi:MAG: hypothetical protein ACKO40_13150 [Planctomycetaceae bacterium]